MLVKPRPGYKIRDPLKKDMLPAEGREVNPSDLYWATLLRDGDVVEAQATARAKPVTRSEPEA